MMSVPAVAFALERLRWMFLHWVQLKVIVEYLSGL